MSKPIVKPKNYTTMDAYIKYAERLLATTPESYSSSIVSKHRTIYNKDKKVIITYKLFKDIISRVNK